MQQQPPRPPSATPPTPSEIPAGQPWTGTMAVAAIRQSGLAPAAIAKLVSAVTTAARIAAPGMPKSVALDRLRMDALTLNGIYRQARRGGTFSLERLTSWTSELRRVMRMLGLVEPNRRGQAPTSLLWRELLGRLPQERQWEMVDFCRFAAHLGIAPADVDSFTLSAFHRRCQERVLCRNPDARVGKVATTWNWAVANVPGRPGVALEPSSRQDVYTFRWTAFPPSLREDLERYKAKLAGQNIEELLSHELFAEDGPIRWRRSGRRLATIRLKERALREAAAALVRTGMPPDEIRLLRDLVHPVDRAEAILRFHLRRDRGHSTCNAWRVAEELRLLARDFCNSPSAETEQIATWAKRIRPPRQRGITEKNASRVRALMQPRPYAVLLHLPSELMRRANDLMKPAQGAPKPQAAATLAMYAAALEILLVCPLRRKNLVELGKRAGAGRPAGSGWRPSVSAMRTETIEKMRSIVGGESDPLLLVVRMAMDDGLDTMTRLSAASIALPYLYPKLSATTVDARTTVVKVDGNARIERLNARLERLIEAPAVQCDDHAVVIQAAAAEAA